MVLAEVNLSYMFQVSQSNGSPWEHRDNSRESIQRDGSKWPEMILGESPFHKYCLHNILGILGMIAW